jgi:hypothetical protein
MVALVVGVKVGWSHLPTVEDEVGMVGKDECWLLVKRRADEASINEVI